MYHHAFYNAVPVKAPLQADDVELDIRQQPIEALWTQDGKEKVRKPIDPPPIVQVTVKSAADPQEQFLHSPYLFMCVSLWPAAAEEPETRESNKSLLGSLVSSLHRLKDVDNSDGGFFVFGDVSTRMLGVHQLHFSLFDLRKDTHEVVFLKAATSQPFTVVHPKDFKGMNESTYLSRSFSDQGVRLRLRKEPRGLLGTKRQFTFTSAPLQLSLAMTSTNSQPLPQPQPQPRPLPQPQPQSQPPMQMQMQMQMQMPIQMPIHMPMQMPMQPRPQAQPEPESYTTMLYAPSRSIDEEIGPLVKRRRHSDDEQQAQVYADGQSPPSFLGVSSPFLEQHGTQYVSMAAASASPVDANAGNLAVLGDYGVGSEAAAISGLLSHGEVFSAGEAGEAGAVGVAASADLPGRGQVEEPLPSYVGIARSLSAAFAGETGTSASWHSYYTP